MTSDALAAIYNPFGNVKIIPVPTAAANEIRLKNETGTVGGVAHANAVVTSPAGSATSSANSVTGVVGVTPNTAGRPIPNTEAVAAAMKIPISWILGLHAAPAMISRHGLAIVTFVVLFDKEYIPIIKSPY
jgi:hypothetical protein